MRPVPIVVHYKVAASSFQHLVWVVPVQQRGAAPVPGGGAPIWQSWKVLGRVERSPGGWRPLRMKIIRRSIVISPIWWTQDCYALANLCVWSICETMNALLLYSGWVIASDTRHCMSHHQMGIFWIFGGNQIIWQIQIFNPGKLGDVPLFQQSSYFRQKYLEIASCAVSLLNNTWVRVEHSQLQRLNLPIVVQAVCRQDVNKIVGTSSGWWRIEWKCVLLSRTILVIFTWKVISLSKSEKVRG